jgi:tetratricopeptide (TPR) repeat protein
MVFTTALLVLAGTTEAQTAAVTPKSFTETRTGMTQPSSLTPDRPALTPEMRGDIYMARKMYREAIEMYRQMPEDSALSWNKIGIAYHQMLEMPAAKRHYEQAIKLNRNYSEAVNNLGTIYYAQKKYRKAVGLYKRALKINPQSASVLSNLGTAYFAQKKYDLAFKTYQEALAIDPEVFEHRGAAGVILQERSVEERAKFHFYLAKTYAQAGQHERALLYLRKALEEGFRDREKLKADPEFAKMQEIPEFQELLAYQPKVL